MNPTPALKHHMTTDQYNRFITRAHASYLKNRIKADDTTHVVDLAVETASFFEALVHIMDVYTSPASSVLINTSHPHPSIDIETAYYFKETMEQLNNPQKPTKKSKKGKKKN